MNPDLPSPQTDEMHAAILRNASSALGIQMSVALAPVITTLLRGDFFEAPWPNSLFDLLFTILHVVLAIFAISRFYFIWRLHQTMKRPDPANRAYRILVFRWADKGRTYYGAEQKSLHWIVYTCLIFFAVLWVLILFEWWDIGFADSVFDWFDQPLFSLEAFLIAGLLGTLGYGLWDVIFTPRRADMWYLERYGAWSR